MALGERIYKLRIEKKMSQGDLADVLDVSRQSISKWETNGSVPELDTLIKLSKIFGISLDELIIGKEAEQQERQDEPEVVVPSQAEPKIVYVEKPVMQTLSAAQILGIILTLGSLLCVFVFDDLLVALYLCLPVAIWGILCLVTKHPLLWCSWSGSVTWWVYMFILAQRWESQTLFLIIGILLIGAALFYTIYLQKKERIHVPVCGWVLLILLLASAGVLLSINLTPPSVGIVGHSTPIISVPDVSMGLK